MVCSPADDEWHTRQIVTEVMIDTIKQLKPEFPTISDEDKADLDKALDMLKMKSKSTSEYSYTLRLIYFIRIIKSFKLP